MEYKHRKYTDSGYLVELFAFRLWINLRAVVRYGRYSPDNMIATCFVGSWHLRLIEPVWPWQVLRAPRGEENATLYKARATA